MDGSEAMNLGALLFWTVFILAFVVGAAVLIRGVWKRRWRSVVIGCVLMLPLTYMAIQFALLAHTLKDF